MFKKILTAVFVLALALGMVVSPTHAATPVTYESSIQVRNLLAEQALFHSLFMT